MRTEVLVASAAALVAVMSAVGVCYLAMVVRSDRRRLRAIDRRIRRAERLLSKQHRRWGRLQGRVAKALAKSASSSRGGPDPNLSREAHRLALEDARAIEHLLMDVNELRRDLEALKEDR